METGDFSRFRLFLSASVPATSRSAEFLKEKNAQLRIEEAVMSLARTVFAHKGQLVFGGHPSISPLVATVATEYAPFVSGSEEEINVISGMEGYSYGPGDNGFPPVVIYQSDIFRPIISPETTQMLNSRAAFVRWTQKDPAETLDHPTPVGPRFPESVKEMRECMMEDAPLDAMVAIGGMEGIFDERRAFKIKYPDKPVFIFKSTGGASLNLAGDKYPKDSLDIFVEDKFGDESLAGKENSSLAPVYLSFAGELVNLVIRSNQQGKGFK